MSNKGKQATNQSVSSIVNLSESLVRLGGDKSLLLELIDIFLEDAPELIAEITQAVEEGNATGFSGLAHRLKGLAANFSAHQCSTAAWELEKQGRGGLDVDPTLLLADLCAETGAVQAELEKYRTASSPG